MKNVQENVQIPSCHYKTPLLRSLRLPPHHALLRRTMLYKTPYWVGSKYTAHISSTEKLHL